jgi:translation initiation factor IF-2
MRNFLLGVAAVTLFGFLVLWKLPPLPRAPGEIVDTETSTPAPVSTPPPPPVAEPNLAPAIAPAQTPTAAKPAPVPTEPAAVRLPTAIKPTPAPTTAAAPTPQMDAARASSDVRKKKKIREAEKPKPAGATASKFATARRAQKTTPAHPADHGKRPKGH